MSIGSKIEELLYKKQVTQKKMAEELKISTSTLNNYIRDYRIPDVETLKLIAIYFDVSMDYLLDFQAYPSKNINNALNVGEYELISNYRKLTKEQQGFLREQTKLLIKMNF